MSDYAGKHAKSHQAPGTGAATPLATPGKRTLVEQLATPAAVQRRANAEPGPSDPQDAASVHAAAAQGTASPASPLPHGESIQRLFGRHDLSQVQAHTGPDAARSARAMGASAYATGNHVVLGDRSDLHTVAHEAAHVIQQRGGVQLQGGVGAAGDPHERHADAVADRVVAGRSAEDLLDGGSAGGASPAVQRKDSPDDAKILEGQARLQGTDVEIPALEGALLATRQEAMKRGLLSRASYDAGLALSRAMTQLQPAVAAKGAVDKDLQNRAANAAQQLFAALQHETADEKNFRIEPSPTESTAITSRNPYTDETRVTTYFFVWVTSQNTFSGFQHLPEFIRQGKWEDAFRGYRGLLDGLDLWIADQLRKTGKGSRDEALGNAQEHHAQLLTGLEQIAGKHAKRLPALFHPDPKTVESEKAAGRPTADAVPMNVYFWKDEHDGKFHIYDLTTPGHPQEQTVDGQPTAAMMNTFFEEVARYPAGEVRYTLPGGAAGRAPTTGKIKWYEWAGYAGLVLAGVGLALFTGGASVAATVCFAAGAVAGGVSAGGHLVDSTRLGTATTATVVLDVAQIAASFASFGALSITVKAGGVAAALAGSRAFVPLLSAAAVADSVQLVALTDITSSEMNKIQNNPAGSSEDKQRAISILLTQLIVTGGLTALSVQGARNVRALSGKPLELVEQNGVKVLRVVGEPTPEPVVHPESPPKSSESGTTSGGTPKVNHDTSAEVGTKTPATTGGTSSLPASDAERWLASLESGMNAEEKAKLAKMTAGKTPQQARDMFGGDLNAARERVRAGVRIDQERAAIAVQSKERVAALRKQIADRGLMNDPEVRAIVDGTTPQNRAERIPMLRDKLMMKILQAEAEHAHHGAEVIDGVKVYEKLPEATLDEWGTKNPGKKKDGLTQRADGLYMQRGEIDMMIVERQPDGGAKVIAREEIKTGVRDTNADARGQIDDQTALLSDAAAGKKAIRLEVGGRDITGEIDLASDATANKSTRGPAGKGFDKSLGVSASDLEAMCKDLLDKGVAAAKETP